MGTALCRSVLWVWFSLLRVTGMNKFYALVCLATADPSQIPNPNHKTHPIPSSSPIASLTSKHPDMIQKTSGLQSLQSTVWSAGMRCSGGRFHAHHACCPDDVVSTVWGAGRRRLAACCMVLSMVYTKPAMNWHCCVACSNLVPCFNVHAGFGYTCMPFCWVWVHYACILS